MTPTRLERWYQPHFIFNTLSALQHWVDEGDARAGDLLRALTAFLRGSTELLAREQALLGEEAEIARHYLAIMQARMGERLQVQVSIAPEAATQALPPGLLLSLVENAVEHGIEPALKGAWLQIEASRGPGGFVLQVRDGGAGPALGWREGAGLANSRARLAQRFGERATLELARRGGLTEARLSIRACPA